LWVCLVCGFIGCGRFHHNHIKAHYEEHFHTYAMNTGEKIHISDYVNDSDDFSNFISFTHDILSESIYFKYHT
jgi:uncharacterized UBP type Zn finger protein